MRDLLEIASGTVAGRDHRVSGKNNHDAYYSETSPNFFIGVTCDGCGSSAHSEVGAKLGSRLIVHTLTTHLRRGLRQFNTEDDLSAIPFWDRAREDVLAEMRILANRMGESLSTVVTDFFLFATVGTIITRERAVFFSLGDGFVIVNGEIASLGPFPGNAPPYLAYGLVETTLKTTDPDLLRFNVNQCLPFDELRSFLIGTDGVQDIIRANGKTLPGKLDPVGPISQFWDGDRYFNNPDNVNRRLRLMNQDVQRPDWDNRVNAIESGLLPDDTTFIVGRCKRQKEDEV